jgi:undecaprenyl-diphosphatase
LRFANVSEQIYETLSLMNVRLLLWLNHGLATYPTLYNACLFVTDEGADLAVLLTGAWLWFWTDRQRTANDHILRVRTRTESRARLLAFGCGAVGAYVVARLIAMQLDMARPFATYLPVHGTEGAFDDLRTFGAFPSDHAALLGALPVAFRYWSPTLGRVWIALAVCLSLVRVAVGFHYPSDMVAGAAIGAVSVAIAMAIYDRSVLARDTTARVAYGFSHRRGALLLYPVLGLIGVEFAMHFAHVLRALLVIRQWLA